MTDVRLTATNPEDSSVVPVACNAKGELKLEEPQVTSDLYVEKAGDTMSGNLHLGDTIVLNVDGSAQFANGKIDIYQDGKVQHEGNVVVGNDPSGGLGKGNILGASGGVFSGRDSDEAYIWAGYRVGKADATSYIKANGKAEFSGDVVVGSRNKQWMIVESNGLAHLVEQTRSATRDDASTDSQYPTLRNIPGELTMVEEQLQKVMERLKMAPEAGWEVWDGSD